MEFWLVTAFHERSSLCDYLKSNTVTWEGGAPGKTCAGFFTLELFYFKENNFFSFRISYSMSAGLAYLHEEVPSMKGLGTKPAIAHRSLDRFIIFVFELF